MRVTQRMVTRNYLKNLNDNYNSLIESNRRLTSGRRFEYLSQNLSDGSRALRVRRQLSDCYEQKSTVRDVQGWVDSSWNTINDVNSTVISISEKAIKGTSETVGEQRDIIASEIDNLQQQMVQLLNSKYADKNLFGGTNNIKPPFTVENDKLLYNGVDLSQLEKVDGKFVDKTTGDEVNIPFDDDIFVDLGGGMQLVNGEANETTAFRISFSGAEIVGYGSSTVQLEDGTDFEMSNNIYNLVQQMKDMYNNPAEYSEEKMNLMIDNLESKRSDLMLVTTDMDNRASYLETVDERIESDIETLTTIRTELEGVKDEEEFLKFSMYQFSWMATLKMGSSVLPQSLMDFIN